MSYTIVYDRVGLKLSDGDVLLLWCIGSSNCTMFNYKTRREIYERSWYSFDTKKPIKNVSEWRKTLINYCDTTYKDCENTSLYKSHNSDAISVVDFFNGLWNSVKNAKDSVEEFVEKGNILYILFNDKNNAHWSVASEVNIRNIYTEQDLRKYLVYVKEHNCSFKIGMKNFKRIKK